MVAKGVLPCACCSQSHITFKLKVAAHGAKFCTRLLCLCVFLSLVVVHQPFPLLLALVVVRSLFECEIVNVMD